MFPLPRFPQDHGSAAGGSSRGIGASEGGRLNLLLAYGGWREDTFADQLPPLLQSIGIRCIRTRTAAEAHHAMMRDRVHVAVVDMTTPADDSRMAQETALGAGVLHLLRALNPVPPMILVRPPQASSLESIRGLADALREGAFSVLERPFPMESMLETLRRVVNRHYSGYWPAQ